MHYANDEDDIFEEDTERWMEKKRAERIRELKAELAEARDLIRKQAESLRIMVYEDSVVRNKALDEAVFAARKAYSESADAQGIAEAILALKTPHTQIPHPQKQTV